MITLVCTSRFRLISTNNIEMIGLVWSGWIRLGLGRLGWSGSGPAGLDWVWAGWVGLGLGWLGWTGSGPAGLD